MNKRIFELAKQADLIQWDSLPSGARTPDYESVVKARKFAKLIVRECSGFVCNYPEKYLTRNQSAEICMSMEEHFGITE